MPQALVKGQQTITVEYTLYQQYDSSGDNTIEETHAIYFAPAVDEWDLEGADEEFEITPTLPAN